MLPDSQMDTLRPRADGSALRFHCLCQVEISRLYVQDYGPLNSEP